MEAFIIYILKSAACIGVFVIIYALFLRKTTFFRFNRVFLLIGFFVSLIIPAINFTYEVAIPVTISDQLQTVSQNNVNHESASIDMSIILFTLYISGMVLFSVRNLLSYRKLAEYIQGGKKIDRKEYKLIDNSVVKSPFTVLNYILINSNQHSDYEKELILKHEITHIRQKHWLDLIAGECMLLLQWFNPLMWIYVYLLKENHEFLADRAVIDSGISPAMYQAVLINQEFQGPVFSFSNSFNYSKPLNRLSMMKKTKSASWKRLAALIVIPAFGLFLWASATPRYVLMQLPEVRNESNDSIKKIFDVHVNMEDGNAQTGVITYDIQTQGNADVKVIGAGQSQANVMTIVMDTLSGNIMSMNNAIVMHNRKDDSVRVEVKGFRVRNGSSENPIVIVDGKKITYYEMQQINPDEIDNISVLKDETAIEVYGEAAKKGVIVIQTKEYVKNNPDKAVADRTNIKVIGKGKRKDNASEKIFSTINGTMKNALIIIDGKESSKESLNLLNSDYIESISVLKDSKSVEEYGDKGKHGVIIVTTKK